MSKLKRFLNYEITPSKKRKKRVRSQARLDFELIKILMLFGGPLGLIYYFTAYRKTKLSRMQQLFHSLRLIVRNNAPMAVGLHSLAVDAPNRHTGMVLNSLGDDVEKGWSLSESMALYPNLFPNRYCDLVRIGERSGRLESCFTAILESLDRRRETYGNVTVNMGYILTVFLVQIAIISFLVIKIMPVFVEISHHFNTRPPRYALYLYESARYVDNHIGTIVIGLLVLMFWAPLVYILFRTSRRAQHIGYMVPVVGRILRVGQLHRISEALGELIQSGIPIERAFQRVAEMDLSLPYKRAINDVAERLATGQSLKDALESSSGLLGKTFVAVLGLGEYAGNLEEACTRLTGLYRREHSLRVAVASDAMIPAYVIVGGALNLWILLSTYGMVFGLNDALFYSL